MTRLQLVQFVARTLGTVDPDEITSTTSPATDYISDLVEAVDAASEEIELMHEGGWHWRRIQQTFNTVASTRKYTFATINADCVGIIPFRHSPDSDSYILIGDNPVYFIPYQAWRGYFDRGTRSEQRPQYFTIRHDGGSSIEFDPTPDDVYTVTLDLLIEVQDLSDASDGSPDDNVPRMPARFHKVIGLLACRYMAEYDENRRLSLFEQRYKRWMNDLREDQLPKQRWTVTPIGFHR